MAKKKMSKKTSPNSAKLRTHLSDITGLQKAESEIVRMKDQLALLHRLEDQAEKKLIELGVEPEKRELTFKEQLRASFNKKKQVSIKTPRKDDNPEFEEL